jgi:DNA (cytosine-5)-methyltransferase 1
LVVEDDDSTCDDHSVTEIETRAVTSAFSQAFESDGEDLTRVFNTPDGPRRSRVPGNGEDGNGKGHKHWWRQYWNGEVPKPDLGPGPQQEIRTAEIFCGPGGLAQGVKQACLELGYKFSSKLAIDNDGGAVDVYRHNHGTELAWEGSIVDLLDKDRVEGTGADAKFRYTPVITELDVLDVVTGGIDLLLAGPPCQGHSNLNNHTRRDDERNALYLKVPTFAIAADIPMVIIENVTAVVHDAAGVVDTAKGLFENNDYSVEELKLRADKLGWPQTRSRHFLVARHNRLGPPPLTEAQITDALGIEQPESVLWAIKDLENDDDDGGMTRRPKSRIHTKDPEQIGTEKRLKWFEDNKKKYDLPPYLHNETHREGTSYTAVYGRMDPEKPAPTLTTGFLSPGRGRFIHPTQLRVLTPKEAARLQGFPDNYFWQLPSGKRPKTSDLVKWIGDAVPMPLGHAAALSVLAPGFPN